MPTVPVTWGPTFYQHWREYELVEGLRPVVQYPVMTGQGVNIQRGYSLTFSAGQSGQKDSPLPTDFSGVSFTPSEIPAPPGGGEAHTFEGTVTYPDTPEWQGVEFTIHFKPPIGAMPERSDGRIWRASVRVPQITWASYTFNEETREMTFRLGANPVQKPDFDLGSVPRDTLTQVQIGWGGFTDTVTPVAQETDNPFYTGKQYWADWEHQFPGEDTIIRARVKDSSGAYSLWMRLYTAPLVYIDVEWLEDNKFKLDASRCWDLDGHIVTYEWRVYPSPIGEFWPEGHYQTVFNQYLQVVNIDPYSSALPAPTFVGKQAELNLQEYKLLNKNVQAVVIDLRIVDNDGNSTHARVLQRLYGHDLALLIDRFGGEFSIGNEFGPNITGAPIRARYVTTTFAERVFYSTPAGLDPSLWHSDGPAGTQIGLASHFVPANNTPSSWRRYKSKNMGRSFTGGDIVWTNEYGFADFHGTRDAIDITAAIKISTREIWFKYSTPEGWSEPVLVGTLEDNPAASATVRVRQKWECGSSDLVLYATNRRWISKNLGLTWEER